MFLKFTKYINNLITSVNTFNNNINSYKNITKEPALPAYAYINWGMHLINTGNKEQGIEKLKQSIIINSKNPESYISLGVIYAQNKEFKEALKYFKEALKTDKNNARAWSYIAGVYSELQENNLSQSAFEKALKLDKTNPYTYLNFGIFYMKNKKYANAKDMFKKSYILDTTNSQSLLLWGVVLIEEKEDLQALSKFARILTYEPFNFEALYLSGLCSMKLEKYNECINFCKKSLLLNPNKKENILLITQSYLELKDEINCIETFKKYEETSSDDWKFYSAWAGSLQAFKKYEESCEKYEKALGLKNDEIPVYNGYIFSLMQLNQIQKAKECSEYIIKLDPANALAHYNLAKIYTKEENYSLALTELKTSVALDASYKKAYGDIAKIYDILNETDKAIKYWTLASEYETGAIEALCNLAIIYSDKKQDCQKAIRCIRNAWEKDKTNKKTTFKYGVILLKANELYRAKEKFEEITKDDENYFRAQLAVSECLVKLNKPKEALEILEKLTNENIEKNENFLLIKLQALSKQQEIEPSEERKDSILKICDKMESDFSENKIAKEIKQKYKEL